MAIVHTADGYALDAVPIEQIEMGEYVVTKQSDGDPRMWRVNAKGFKHKQGGPMMITLRAEGGPGEKFIPRCEASFGTPILRVVPAPLRDTPDSLEAGAASSPTDALGNPESDFRHAKCYANTRGGCSRKLSGEHFISHCLIKLYSFDDPDLKIKHDTGYGVRQFVSPKRFVANILCEKHNNDLHTADDAALKFATFMRTISLRYRNGAGEWGDDEEVTISGDDFSAWVLKLILNHVVGKAFVHQRGEFVSPFPPEAVDVLLGRAMWPRTWGLCVSGDTSNTDLKFMAFDRWEDATTEFCSFQPFIHNDGWVGGGIVNLNGVGFGLTVFNASRDNPEAFNIPGNPLRGSLQRPSYMAWELDGFQKRVNFTWNDRWEHKTITYKIVRGD